MQTLIQHRVAITLYALALGAFSLAAFSQTITTGEITGTVMDPAATE
jgi:hypothetical protein